MAKIRVAINGFGRIGRMVTRVLLQKKEIEIVAINDVSDLETMAHLFRYDSVHGKFNGTVSTKNDQMIINDHPITFTAIREAESLPWKKLGINVVLECSGRMKNHADLSKHLTAGADKVILSAAPEDDTIKTIVAGVNDHIIEPTDRILSNASCTTHSAAPLIYLLDKICGVEYCSITTVHSYTGDQRLHDAPHKDLRRARAAAESIIPTTTGAAKALTRVFPHLRDRLGGCGLRVPVPDGSLSDITCTVTRPLSMEEINRAFLEASQTSMKGIIEYTSEPLVSRDIIGNPHSSVFDSELTSVIGNMVKIVGWYDNEMGYSNRLAEFVLRVS